MDLFKLLENLTGNGSKVSLYAGNSDALTHKEVSNILGHLYPSAET